MFSCKIYKIFKNTYFEEHVQTTASVLNRPATLLKRDSNIGVCDVCEIFKNTYFEEHPERLLLSIDLFPQGCIFSETSLYCIRLG